MSFDLREALLEDHEPELLTLEASMRRVSTEAIESESYGPMELCGRPVLKLRWSDSLRWMLDADPTTDGPWHLFFRRLFDLTVQAGGEARWTDIGVVTAARLPADRWGTDGLPGVRFKLRFSGALLAPGFHRLKAQNARKEQSTQPPPLKEAPQQPSDADHPTRTLEPRAVWEKRRWSVRIGAADFRRVERDDLDVLLQRWLDEAAQQVQRLCELRITPRVKRKSLSIAEKKLRAIATWDSTSGAVASLTAEAMRRLRLGIFEDAYGTDFAVGVVDLLNLLPWLSALVEERCDDASDARRWDAERQRVLEQQLDAMPRY